VTAPRISRPFAEKSHRTAVETGLEAEKGGAAILAGGSKDWRGASQRRGLRNPNFLPQPSRPLGVTSSMNSAHSSNFQPASSWASMAAGTANLFAEYKGFALRQGSVMRNPVHQRRTSAWPPRGRWYRATGALLDLRRRGRFRALAAEKHQPLQWTSVLKAQEDGPWSRAYLPSQTLPSRHFCLT
jgi:hypothetical protein